MTKLSLSEWLILAEPDKVEVIGFTQSTSRKFVKKILRHGEEPKISGHYAVTRSLIEGLKANHVNFNYNQPFIKSRHQNIYVVAGVKPLEWAIELKKRGYVKNIVAGPNIVVLPNDSNGILKNPLIDVVITPSEWVKQAYIQQCEELKNKIVCWQAGVDLVSWPSSSGREKNQVLIYWKNEPNTFVQKVDRLLSSFGYQTKIIKYGDYKLEQYKDLLKNSRFSVFISRSESQGIALYEAWASNVPTLAWDPEEYTFQGWNFKPSTSTPFLTQETGFRWKTLAELRKLLNQHEFDRLNPRVWIEKNATDKVAAMKVYKILKEV